MALPAILAAILPTAIDRIVTPLLERIPDPAERQRVEMEVKRAAAEQARVIQQTAAEIVKTEAASSHWLAANWRPITALTFVGLIVARWLGYAAPNMDQAEVLALWDVVEIMIGGYVISRGAEKVAPVLTGAVKKRND